MAYISGQELSTSDWFLFTSNNALYGLGHSFNRNFLFRYSISRVKQPAEQ